MCCYELEDDFEVLFVYLLFVATRWVYVMICNIGE